MNAELAKHLKNYGASCALGEQRQRRKGHGAVFTEQGASASQMAAAKFLDTVSKLLDMAGERSDAISAYTQAQMTGPQMVTYAEQRMSWKC